MRLHYVYVESADIDLSEVTNLGGRIVETYPDLPHTVLIELPDSMVASLEDAPGFGQVSPADGEIKTLDVAMDVVESESYADVWGIQKMGAQDIHAEGNFGKGESIVIFDSGGKSDHEDIIVAGGQDFVTPGTPPEDDNGHGTHVHGTIAAQLNGKGVVGMAPHAKVYHAKILGNTGAGSWATIAGALQFAIDLAKSTGKKVVTNHSYGGTTNPGQAVEAAYQSAADNGVILVCSAGNSGQGVNTVGYPAQFSSCIAIAATDINDNRASFSSTGPAVEVAAPGVNVQSTCFEATNRYCAKSGTSMSAPHVTGAIALALAAGVEDPRAAISVSTDRDTRDELFGYGILDARKLVKGGADAPLKIGRKVRLDGSFSTDPDGEVIKYEWRVITDGAFLDRGPIVEITYGVLGVQTITLRVTDNGNPALVHEMSKTVEIVDNAPANLPPVAEFTITDLTGASQTRIKKAKKIKVESDGSIDD
jgi:subtilisin family serine protease